MIFFDFNMVTLMLLFEALQKPVVLAFFSVINASIQVIDTNTEDLYNESMFELSFDCRKIYFQDYLNEKHDNVLRRIRIRDINNSPKVYLYNPSEQNETTFLYNPTEVFQPLNLYNPGEILGLIDFEVVVPIGFVYNEALLISHIEKFRLPGMKYQIVEE